MRGPRARTEQCTMSEFSLDLDEDQLQLQKWVHDFAENVVRPAGHEWDEREETPWPIIQEAANIGLYSFEFIANAFMDKSGLLMPIAAEELAWGDAGIALAILGSTLGLAGIAGNGTPEQLMEWGPQCFGTPEKIQTAAFAVSEPDAGSDVSSLRTKAVYDEAKDEWVLNGTKTWITNGGIADIHVVVASVDPELGVDRGDHHVDVGNAAIGDPRLRAVDDPLVLGLVVDGAGAQRRHVRPGVGLGHGEGGQLDLLRRAKALRAPLHQLLGGAVAGDPGEAQGAPQDGQGDAGVTPGELLGGDGHEQSALVQEGGGDELEGVQPDLGRLLDDRPRGLLPLIPLVGGGADHVLREVVHPLLELQLILVEVQGEFRHGALLRSGPRAPHVRAVSYTHLT